VLPQIPNLNVIMITETLTGTENKRALIVQGSVVESLLLDDFPHKSGDRLPTTIENIKHLLEMPN